MSSPLIAVLDRGALGKRIAVVVAGIGVALAMAAEMALVVRGAAGGVSVANVTATAFLIALVCTVLVERRSR